MVSMLAILFGSLVGRFWGALAFTSPEDRRTCLGWALSHMWPSVMLSFSAWFMADLYISSDAFYEFLTFIVLAYSGIGCGALWAYISIELTEGGGAFVSMYLGAMSICLFVFSPLWTNLKIITISLVISAFASSYFEIVLRKRWLEKNKLSSIVKKFNKCFSLGVLSASRISYIVTICLLVILIWHSFLVR